MSTRDRRNAALLVLIWISVDQRYGGAASRMTLLINIGAGCRPIAAPASRSKLQRVPSTKRESPPPSASARIASASRGKKKGGISATAPPHVAAPEEHDGSRGVGPTDVRFGSNPHCRMIVCGRAGPARVQRAFSALRGPPGGSASVADA